MNHELNFRTGGPSLAEEMQQAGVFLDTRRIVLIRSMQRAEKRGDEKTREWIRKQLVRDSRRT
jgi:hypothetical protein